MRSFFGVLAALTAIIGCTSVSFRDRIAERDMASGDVGYEYYPPRPYLLVQATDKGREPKVFTVPDVTRKRYVKHHPGWGTMEFGFKSQDGLITEFNHKFDSKAAETVTAGSGMITALGGLAPEAAAEGVKQWKSVLKDIVTKSLGDTPMKPEDEQKLWAGTPDQSQPFTLKFLIKIADAIEQKVIPTIAGEQQNEPFRTMSSRLLEAARNLRAKSTFTYVGVEELIDKVLAVRADVREIIAPLKEELAILRDVANDREAFEERFAVARRAATSLEDLVKQLDGFAGPTLQPLELFEIQNVNGKLQFTRARTF